MAADSDTPNIVTVSEGFYVRQAVDNITWIDLGEYALAVDALEQPELEEEIFAAIASTIGNKPVRYLLNTHTHYDHVALNDAFRRRGAEIVNQRTCRIAPDGRWFEGSQRRVGMLPMGRLSHTAEDCVVWAPGDKVLLTGDIFGWGLIPTGRLDDQGTQRLLATYQRMIDFGAETVIPGHGPLCATAELRRWVEYFNWLREQVAAAVAAGKKDGRILRDISPPADMTGWWRFVQWKHEDTLAKVLRAVRSGSLGPA